MNFENQPDRDFPSYQNTIYDQDETSVNDTTDQHLGPGSCQTVNIIKSESVDINIDWALTNSADQLFEMLMDNISSSNLATDQVLSRLNEIRALYGHCVSARPPEPFQVKYC